MAVDYQAESPKFLFQFLSYMKIDCGYSEQTVYQYFFDLRLFLRFLVAEKEGRTKENLSTISISHLHLDFIRQVERYEISDFLSWLALSRDLNQNTRNRKIAVIKSFYKYLEEMEFIEKNVSIKIKTVKSTRSLPKYLEKDTIQELLDSINGKHWIRDRAIVILMLSCGLRVSEVAGLNRESLQSDHVSILGKGSKERQVYLSPLALEFMDDYLDVSPKNCGNALFFSQEKQRISKRTIQAMVDKYLSRIGLEDYSCHKLRHTAATQLLKSGVNIREIQEILGHESISTTEIYTHVSNDALKRAMNNLEF